MSENLIGRTVWRFDSNWRVYREGESGGPIYREYWRPIKVFGENRRSWLAGHERRLYKIPKTGPHPGFALTAQEVEDSCWANEHRYRVLRLVENRLRGDFDFLKKLADMVGYEPEKA